MSRLPDILQALRPKQWTKNLVVVAVFGFAFGDRSQALSTISLLRIASAFALFCLASSSVYLMNDVHDVEADRRHPAKQFRPVASGAVPVSLASALALTLGLLSLSGSLLLSPRFALVIAAYGMMQIAYTFWLKQVALLDVFIIALGFVLRAVGGGVALQVAISPWLLVCAFLLALFLALCKRRHEKNLLDGSASQHRISLGQYPLQLLDQLIAIVCAATIVSYSVYTLSPDTIHKFGTPLLSLTIPVVVFGIFRYLDLVYRGGEGGRPENTLLTDRVLMADLALYGLTALAVFAYAHGLLHPL